MRICWSNLMLIAVVVLLGSLSMLASCGQKGDLYPPEAPAESEPRNETDSQQSIN